METLEWNLPANVWAGLNTKYDPLTKMVGPDDFITGSANYDISPTGNITKRSKTNLYNPTPLAFPIKDEFEMIFDSGTRHKLVVSNGSLYYTIGDGIFHLVHAGYIAAGNFEFAAMNDLVYFGNGIDDPQVYDMGTSYGGVVYTPPTVAAMGVHAPATPVTFAADSAGGAVPAGAHTYKVTFLYRDSQESNGGPASATHTVTNPNNTVHLTAVPVGGLGVTARKIYRDDNNGLWVLVGTIPNNTAVIYTDAVAIGTTPIPEDNNNPPLWSLVTQFRDRLWVAGVADAQSTLYYSDAGLADVWPTNNFIACNTRDSITAITSFNDKVTVFGKSSFGIILGTTSDDFRYIDVSPNIGCVDCRSIQIVTVNGVPKLQWLSAFGMYQWDGSNIELISDKIANLLQFNIQQSQGAFNRNIQTAPADFQAGTSTPGINLTSIPGSVTTAGYMKAGDLTTLTDNPTKSWDSQDEWENGSSVMNLATVDNLDQVSLIPNNRPSISQSTLSNLTVFGAQDPTNPDSLATTIVAPDFTGATNGPAGSSIALNVKSYAIPFSVTRAGTVNNVTVNFTPNFSGFLSVKAQLHADATGVPGAAIGSLVGPGTGSGSPSTYTLNTPISAGLYWLVMSMESVSSGDKITNVNVGTQTSHIHTSYSLRTNAGNSTAGFGVWSSVANYGVLTFTFTQGAVATSGTLTTPTLDTKCIGPISLKSSEIGQSLTAPGVRILTSVYRSSTPFFTSDVNVTTYDSLLGQFGGTITDTNKRYWYTVMILSTTDDRFSVLSTVPQLINEVGSTWISEAIDHTTDITTLDSLLLVSTAPSGTSAVVSISTSADNSSYTPYTTIGTATPQRYSKVKLVMAATSFSELGVATTSSIRLNWSIVSTLISYAINTIATPTQWGLFQTDFELNTGTAVFQTRSAATQGGLGAALWTTVTNGQLIPSALNPWIQWRVTISSSVNQVPEIKSVTINWLLVSNTGIRVASLFFNQTYYLAAAEINSLTNNIVLYYDKEGRWGQYKGLTINTMGTFYGQAYYGDATVGNYTQWLNSSILNADPVEVDMRSKAYSNELISNDKTKALRHLIVECDDSLATITPFYSVDEGNTWIGMTDIVTGAASFTGTGTTRHRKIRFTPVSSTVKWGYSIIVRLYNNDQYPLNIVGMRCKAYVSERPVLLR